MTTLFLSPMYLQLFLVSNGGKFMKKTLIGEAYIWLDKVDMRKRVVSWHKLFVSSTQTNPWAPRQKDEDAIDQQTSAACSSSDIRFDKKMKRGKNKSKWKDLSNSSILPLLPQLISYKKEGVMWYYHNNCYSPTLPAPPPPPMSSLRWLLSLLIGCKHANTTAGTETELAATELWEQWCLSHHSSDCMIHVRLCWMS